MELSARSREILKLVVDTFIATGEPVGSKSVMEQMKKPPSSATIRNEMAAMEDLGLLEHPHTSAGRVPTGRGYRLYVDSLMESFTLSFEEKLLLTSLLSDKYREPDALLKDVTTLLARMTGCAVVSTAREFCGTVKRFDGVYVSEHSFLLVLITSSGKAVTRLLRTDLPLTQEAVAFLVKAMDEHLAKKELGGITLERMIAMEQDLGTYRGIIPPLLQIIYDVMADLGKTHLSVCGMSNLLAYPEFADQAKLLISQLESEEELLRRFGSDPPSHLRVHVATGSDGLDSASTVSCPFRLKGGLQGSVSIIGPKRMNYAEAMARLQYLAKEIHAGSGFEPTLPLIETKEK